MKRIYLLALALCGFAANAAVKSETPTQTSAELFLTLPYTFNSPASSALDRDGDLYFTSPNFHNEVLIKAGQMKVPAAPTIGKVDKQNRLTAWYTFKPEDMESTSGKIAPFGIAFGPDGHAYVADMQLWFGGQSRILRINVEGGKATGVSVVATGFSFPNALVWKGDELFVSDTVLKAEPGKTISGVYRVNLNELDPDKPLVIAPYVDAANADPHLFETFVSNGKLGFGANGLAIDGEGNLYTGIMEEGSVHKTTVSSDGKKVSTAVFAEGMIATDGMKWDRRTNKIYITDLFANAVYSIDMAGRLTLLAQNANTDGADGKLDGPSELSVRGNQVIVMNFDAVFDSPDMVNRAADAPHTLSVIHID